MRIRKLSDFRYPNISYLSMHNNCKYNHTAISEYADVKFLLAYCIWSANILDYTRIFNNITNSSIYNIRCKAETLFCKSTK